MKYVFAAFGLIFSFSSIGQDRCSQADAAGEVSRCLNDETECYLSANLPRKKSERAWWSTVTPSITIEDTLSPSTKVKSGLVRGENILVWVIDGDNCLQTTDTIKIRVIGEPKEPIFSLSGNGLSGFDLSQNVAVNLCTDAGYSISGSGTDDDNNEEVSWEVEGSAVRFNGEENSPYGELEVLRSGESTICEVLDNGCYSKQTCGKIIVHSTPVAVINMSSTVEVCEGENAELKASYSDAGYKGVWELKKGKSEITNKSDLIVEVLSLTEDVWFNWKVQSEFCGVDNKSVHIKVIPKNVLGVTLTADSIKCVGEILQVDANVIGDSAEISWESTWGIGSELNNSLLLKPFEVAGSYSVAAVVSSDEKCSTGSAMDKVVFTVLGTERPELIYNELEVCAPEQVIIKSNSGPLTWFKGEEQLSHGVEFKVSESGRYHALPVGNDCVVEKSEFVDVVISNTPDVQLKSPITIKAGEELVFEPISRAEDFEWSPSKYLSDAIDKNPIFKTSKKGQYQYTLKARNGDCVSKKSLVVKVE